MSTSKMCFALLQNLMLYYRKTPNQEISEQGWKDINAISYLARFQVLSPNQQEIMSNIHNRYGVV